MIPTFKIIIVLYSCCIGFVSAAMAQTVLPVINASAKNVKIRDGVVLKDWWYIIPETKPDIYWVDFPYKEQVVTFITDKDSISFKVKQGETYDFVILVNGKDSAYTQISGTHQHKISYTGSQGSDTIPFAVQNNRIYFEGKLNSSEKLNIQFDLGAGMSNINSKSTYKVKINFDSSTYLINSQGRNKARLSTVNEVTLGKLVFSPDAFVETKNMAKWEDLIIGNSLFLNKYLEIDYDRKAIIVHSNMPAIDTSWKKLEMQLDGGVRPMIEAAIEIDGMRYSDWFVFDTGDSGNGILSNELTVGHGIYDKLTKLIGFGNRKIASLPKIIIAGFSFESGTIVLEKPGKDLLPKSVLGNKILKNFNVIIDNRYGYLYLKPNQFFYQS
jgi:hypothetical protein